MPTSGSSAIPAFIELVLHVEPESFLDVGMGFGRWGMLVRDLRDIRHARYFPADWRTRIDGVEIHEPYVMPHQRFLYTNIFVGSIADALPKLPEYDLIMAGDVLEHMEAKEAREVSEALFARTRRCYAFTLPIGPKWKQGEVLGNVHETHRSTWSFEDAFRLGPDLWLALTVYGLPYFFGARLRHRSIAPPSFHRRSRWPLADKLKLAMLGRQWT